MPLGHFFATKKSEHMTIGVPLLLLLLLLLLLDEDDSGLQHFSSQSKGEVQTTLARSPDVFAPTPHPSFRVAKYAEHVCELAEDDEDEDKDEDEDELLLLSLLSVLDSEADEDDDEDEEDDDEDDDDDSEDELSNSDSQHLDRQLSRP